MPHAVQDDAPPTDIAKVIEAGGSLSMDQFRRLIAWEAKQIGLTYDEAVQKVRAGEPLKNSPYGDSLELIIPMLWADKEE
jgi:hypothetical protein